MPPENIAHINDLAWSHCSFHAAGVNQPVLSRIVSRLTGSTPIITGMIRTRPFFSMSAGDDLVGAVFDELMGEDPESFALARWVPALLGRGH